MLKLGTQTGSVMNHLMSAGSGLEPEVGMGATLLHWTDRAAATVVEIWKEGKADFIALTEDDARLVSGSGLSERQVYEFTPRPDGHRKVYRRRPGGTWEAVYKKESTGRWSKNSGPGLLLGERQTYYDPSF
jgi:hypothetical protein